MKLLNITIAFGWILLIILISESYLLKASICCGIYYIAELVFLFKQFLEQKEQQQRSLLNKLTAIAMDTLEQLKNK